jgi:succinoglycan biosynthesis transport protein ExoP
MEEYLKHFENQDQQNKKVREFLHLLFKYKWNLVLFTVLLVTPVLIYCINQPYEYQSTAKILIKIKQDSLNIDPDLTGQILAAGYKAEEHVNTEATILKSQGLIERVVDVVGVDSILGKQEERKTTLLARVKDQVKQWISPYLSSESEDSKIELTPRQKAVNVIYNNLTVNAKTNILILDYKSTDPHHAKFILDNLITVYQKYHVEILKPKIDTDFFIDGHNKVLTQLTEKEEALRDFKLKNNIDDIQEQKKSLIALLQDVDILLTESRAKEKSLESKIQILGKMVPVKDDKPGETAAPVTSDTIEYLQREITAMRMQETELKNKFSEDLRPIRDLQNRIATAQQLLQEEYDRLKDVTPVVGSSSSSNKESLSPAIAYQAAKMELDEVRASIASLKADKEAYDKRIMELTQYDMIVTNYNREIRELESTLSRYQSNLQRSMISSALEENLVHNLLVIQPPELPFVAVQSFKNRYRLIAMALFGGLFGGIGLIFLVYFLNPVYLSPGQLEDDLNVPVLCSIQRGEI